ncbi:Lactoylglutathione lyase [Hartmannibacter diazotrophicus]|uniref:Lactoylglutathione lyase n=1 Tax=Hartmannibacter diazotrophicus TaxID=1482074 RepID=A0A2C9DA24_9HYPH|nr:VOC family protein [Hartmannibacter diazotrophicus]SON57083.1 Lactoylglutathione lyase [Hartmannibacter diazotrophicus]
MAKAVHSMVRVLDEARSVNFYTQAFGLAISDRLDFDDFTLIYMKNAEADFEVELTVNKGRTEPYALGDGYGHIAFVVDDLDAEHARFTDLGFSPRKIVEFNRDGGLLARFFFVEDPDGYKIEVLQRHGRFR